MSDFVALTKPRITLMVVLTAAGGMFLAPTAPDVVSILVALGSLALVVASANSLNCWLERDVDRLMSRTKRRPLPAQRLPPRPALVFALALGAIALPMLLFLVNPVTGLLGAISLILYVAVYTPMKQLSPAALLVGAVPGAMPPLMGWTAATGTIDGPGLVLFGILFLWQLPHFIAISVFREKEYAAAGLKVLPSIRGRSTARLHATVWAVLLIPVSLGLYVLDVAGELYAAAAVSLGVWYLVATFRGLASPAGNRGARRAFVASLVYLPLLIGALLVSAL